MMNGPGATRPASVLLVAAGLAALLGCEEATRRRVAPTPTRSFACGIEATDATRCSGTVVVRCDGAGTWATELDCADTGQICRADGMGASCVDAASSCASAGTCRAGTPCTDGAACASRVCGAAGTCLDDTCGNGRQDGAETGVDFGGPCPLCFGEACSAPEQCVTNDCRGGSCSEPSCTDGVRNGRESSADCGGDCQPCSDGATCRGAGDCASGICESGRCAAPPPSCTDGSKSGDETDVDCGGPCPGCGLNRSCRGDADCVSAFCNLGACDRATCADGILNQGEVDVDCGGPCPACADGRACTRGADCASGRCDGAICGSCRDGLRSGGETGVDCGGPCSPCEVGTPCSSPAECASGRCEGGACASCSDGRQSGRETDIDCGGPCMACTDGRSCGAPQDCEGGGCDLGRCCTLNRCGTCGPAPVEVCNGRDDDCDCAVDEDLPRGDLCPEQQGVCSGARAACRGAQGWVCDTAVYQAHSSRYETTETSCDGADNDCDGTRDQIACGSAPRTCDYGFCGNGVCSVRYREGGTVCYTGTTPNPDTEQTACSGFRQCYQTFAICNCRGVDANGRGINCSYLPNPSFGGTPRSVESCSCANGDYLSYVYTEGGRRIGGSDSRCVSCVGNGLRYACFR